MVKILCKAKTITGKACRAPAGAEGLCFFHADPGRARSLGRIGGRKNRRTSMLDLQVPDNPHLAPPGWYLLTIVDHQRRPSCATWVQLTARD